VFSGIVKGTGQVLEYVDIGDDRRLTIGFTGIGLQVLRAGDSVAVNGACLTVIESKDEYFSADISLETLSKTTLGDWKIGDTVNLESALLLGDSVDGHFVTGHVDGIGHVESLVESGRSIVFGIRIDEALTPFLASKGSIAVDGVSLTVNDIKSRTFHVNIIPHTRDITVIAEYRLGTAVNIEVDIIARYLERRAKHENNPQSININLLKNHGYTS
jgi:riboflavin synthase